MSDISDRLSVNVPSTDDAPAYSPRPSPRLSTDGPLAELPPEVPAYTEVPGPGEDDLAGRPPAYTASPDPTASHPVVSPMPLVRSPRLMPSVKHPRVGAVQAIRYAPGRNDRVFCTLVPEGNWQTPYVRRCEFDGHMPAREQALGFALSPDPHVYALVRAGVGDHAYNGYRIGQSLEVRIFHIRGPGTPSAVFAKGKKINFGLSTPFDACDDACDGPDPCRPMAFSSDGSILAVGVRGHRIALCSLGLGKVKTTLAMHMAEVTHIRFSRHGSRMASCSLDGIVRVTGPEAECVGRMDQSAYQKGARRAVDLAISHDGSRVVAVWGTRVVVWWPDTGASTAYDLWQKRDPAAEGWPLALSPCCRLLACRTDKGMDVLDSHTGDVLLMITQPSPVTAAAFSSDGEVVSLGRSDGFVESWEIY